MKSVDECDPDLPRVLIANDLYIHVLACGRDENALDEVLVHPGFEFAHPEQVSRQSRCFEDRQGSTHQRVVFGESVGLPPEGGGTEPMSPAGGVPLEYDIWLGAGPPLAGPPLKGVLCSMMICSNQVKC